MEEIKESAINVCKERTLALRDATELLSGKWKPLLLRLLACNGPMRFKDISESILEISPKVLSKDLYELEQHLLIHRAVNNT